MEEEEEEEKDDDDRDKVQKRDEETMKEFSMVFIT